MPTLRPSLLAATVLAAAVVGVGPTRSALAQPTTAPAATAPGAAPMDDAPDRPMADAPVEPDPAVKPLLEEMAAAYKNLKTLDLAGSATNDFDAAGQVRNESRQFTAAFRAPNQFRHELPNELVIVGTGSQVFIYDPAENVYLKQPQPAGPPSIETLPTPAVMILQSQNVSLFLALSGDPVGLLGRGADTIAAAPAVAIDGVDHPGVRVLSEGNEITLALDPQTKLVRRMTVDLSASLKAQGIQPVNKAIVTIEYAKSDPSADVPADRFAFSPPEGATDMATMQRPAAPGGAGGPGGQGPQMPGDPQGMPEGSQ